MRMSPSSPSMSISDDDEIQYMGMRAAPVPAPNPLKPAAITLTVESGDTAPPKTFYTASTRTISIGRVTSDHAPRFATHPSQAVFVCPVMSRSHARITLSPSGQVFIADMKSHHGTVIARGGDQPVYLHLVPDDKYALYDNDLITFGKTVYKQGIPHEPVSVRVAFDMSQPAKPSSPGPVRYGLFASDSEDESSEESIDSTSGTPPGNQLGLPCLPLPNPVLPSISSFPLPPFWNAQVETPAVHVLPPMDVIPEASVPSQHAQPPESPIMFSMQQCAPVPASAPAVDDVDIRQQFQQQVDDLKAQLNQNFYALKQDINRIESNASKVDEWERLRASVKADFPDGLRDRVAELEEGLKRLNGMVAAFGDVAALRAELASSNVQMDSLKNSVATLESNAKNPANVDTLTPSPRKRKRDDVDDEQDSPPRPSVAKRIRRGAPLVVAGAAAMYLGLCSL